MRLRLQSCITMQGSEFIWADWTIWVIAIINIALAVVVTIHAVLWKRDSRAVIGWVGIAWLAPIAGAIFYLALGINRIERRAVALKPRTNGDGRPVLKLSPEEKQTR